MTRLDRFNKRLIEVTTKFNNNIVLVDDIEYAKAKDILKWYCKEHDIVFETTIHNLTDTRVTCGCPICKHEKLIESSLKGIQRRKELKDNNNGKRKDNI